MSTNRYRIRWADQPEAPIRQITADIYSVSRTVRLGLPAGQTVTADVVTARAAAMLLSHSVFAVLRPDGPYLAIEAATEQGWTMLRGTP